MTRTRDIDRRTFLGVAAMSAVAVALPHASPTDDTAYINGLLDEAARTGGAAVIPPGTYHVETLDLRGREHVIVRGSTFYCSGPVCVRWDAGTRETEVTNCRFGGAVGAIGVLVEPQR